MRSRRASAGRGRRPFLEHDEVVPLRGFEFFNFRTCRSKRLFERVVRKDFRHFNFNLKRSEFFDERGRVLAGFYVTRNQCKLFFIRN